MAGRQISGQVTFDDAAFDNATVWVILEEVTHADAPSREVARLEMSGYTHVRGGPPLDFSMVADAVDPTRRYEIRVHVDRMSSGRLKTGDQITMQSYPVLTQGNPDHVDVRLRRIE
jgi:uncharacterized lipoprotein YbaY